jgi:TRAP-type mannitol/chloroaromatic compound transport system substrate-binding protein
MIMKKKLLMFVLILVLVLSSFISVYADTKPITWIAQSCFPIQLPLSRFAIVLWAEKVEAMSGGRLVIELHSSGEIVPGTGVFQAVRDGILDCGQNTPAWQKGLYPAGDLFYTLPGGVTEYHDLMVWMYSGEGMKLEQEMYGDEVVALPLGLTPPEELWTNKPINSLADIYERIKS